MIWAELLAQAMRRPDAPAIRLDTGVLSYADLIERVQIVARGLPERHDDAPGRILLTQTDPLTLLVQVLACWCAGLVPAIAREGRSADSIRQLGDFLSPLAVIKQEADPSPARTAPTRRPLGPRDEALVICTTGTTGVPKLVALPAESVAINARIISSQLGLGADDLIAVTTPLTYMYGLMGASVSGLWGGATLRLFAEPVPPPVVQAAIRRDGITVVQGPPSLMRLFLAYWTGEVFPSVRLVTTGGEALDSSLMDHLRAAFPNAKRQVLYGLTEAGPRVSHRNYDAQPVVDGSVGLPFSHLEWRVEPVAEPDLPAGSGRLALRGASLFLGYINETGGYEGLDPDGWFLSNDLVRRGERGDLYFLDRIDRLFKTGGKLVSPLEIEAVLMRHPAVREARCLKEQHPLLGLVPVAQVVHDAGIQVTGPELRTFAREFLQPHAIPRRFDFHEVLPLGPSGKRC